MALTSVSNFTLLAEHRESLYKKVEGLESKLLFFYKDDNVLDDETHLARKYEKYFYNTVEKLYSPHFNNLFYFDWGRGYSDMLSNIDSPRDNIGHDLSFIKWLISIYGEQKVVMDLLDDTMHCTSAGNYILYFEYLKKSKICLYLDTQQ
jgi:hypothetical protein